MAQSHWLWLQGNGEEEEEEEDEEAEFLECGNGNSLPPDVLQRINIRGWTAYLVAVLQPREDAES